MAERDLVLDGSYTPTYDEISGYMNEPIRTLWQDLNAYIQQEYKALPRITYSKCSAKPGWNVKYHKSGKSLCTLYPEKESFIALVVVTLDLAPLIEAMSDEYQPAVLEIMRSAKPFNGTLWLMIPVDGHAVLDNVKQLLLLKHKIR
ncbi:MAG: hypothetical protein HPY66_1905 [Firmicutes bacterium]|nr:hypothetical protein [Bacillota bacterium]MDI6704832.1 DUF3788 domain-containing protein [Bacillota bacterium]